MVETFDTRRLADVAASHLEVSPDAVHLSRTSAGRHNTSYWVESPAGRFVLRIAPPDETGLLFYERRMMRQEPELHALIRARTAIPVPEIVAYDFSRTRLDRDYLLMAALPGEPMSERDDITERQYACIVEETGGYLRVLHALTAPECLGVDAYGYLGPYHPLPPAPTWVEAFEQMWGRLLDDVVASGCYSPGEGDAFRQLFEHYREHFHHAVESRLLHMDIWSENILVDRDAHITGIVDFDRALWGDPEIEFAILDYTGFSGPSFWKGYGQARDTSLSARIRSVFYLLYEVQKYMPIVVWRNQDPVDARRYKRQCLALAEPLGLTRTTGA